MASSNLTEYERKRLENIRWNDEMMAALKIHSKASQLSAATKRQRVEAFKSFKVSPEKKKPKSNSPVVIRRSLRKQGIPPDSTGLNEDLAEPANKTPIPSSYAEKPPPPKSGPFKMSDAYCGTDSDRTLIDTILSLEKKTLGKYVVPIKKEEENCVDMKLKAENIARVLPGRIMVVKFLPCNDVRMIAAGNKLGNVAFWKLDNVSEDKEDGIYLYHPHTAPVSGILFHQSSLSKVFTSSYDGFLRLLNAERKAFDLAYSSDDAIFSLSQRPSDMNGLYIGEGAGDL